MAIFAGAVFPGSSGPLLPAMRPAIAGEFASKKLKNANNQLITITSHFLIAMLLIEVNKFWTLI